MTPTETPSLKGRIITSVSLLLTIFLFSFSVYSIVSAFSEKSEETSYEQAVKEHIKSCDECASISYLGACDTLYECDYANYQLDSLYEEYKETLREIHLCRMHINLNTPVTEQTDEMLLERFHKRLDDLNVHYWQLNQQLKELNRSPRLENDTTPVLFVYKGIINNQLRFYSVTPKMTVKDLENAKYRPWS